MRYTRQRGSDNIRDARGRGGRSGAAAGVGGLSLIGLILYLLFGVVLPDDGSTSTTVSNPPASSNSGDPYRADATTFDDDTEAFMNAVVINLEDFWAQRFSDREIPYQDATVLYYDDAGVQSGCGYATPEIGPHYCPVDDTVYLDLGFFDQLSQQFGAPGDAAEAYVVGHEYAHHVQNQLGISEQVRQKQAQDPRNANVYSVALELQADCLAGVWMGSLDIDSSLSDLSLERGDLDESLTAAAAVGDDRIQQSATGYVNPETWTHGSSAQRQEWFYQGFDTQDTEACDTFAELG